MSDMSSSSNHLGGSENGDDSNATVMAKKIGDHILLLTLNRPEKLNAINPSLLSELMAHIERVNLDRDIRVVILTGAGKGFCSGADLSSRDGPGAIPGTEGMGELGFIYKYQEYLAKAMMALHQCDKPVIAAVNGAAVGGGLAFSLACDFRVASTKAKFGSVFIKTGLSSCDVGTSFFLPKLIPPTIALELMTTGRIFPASEALQLGMLNRLVEPDQLIQASVSLAQDIIENSEYGVWMTKKGFWQNLTAQNLQQAMELENRTQALGCFTGCMEASMEAFAKGEKPEWPRL